MEIKVEALSKAYRGRHGERVPALANLNLTVRGNEFLVLLGPSGCGKSTLLNIMGGLTEPDEGRVVYELDERDGAGEFGPPAMPGRQPVTAMVFQEFALFPWLTVLENVAFPLSLRKLPPQVREERARHFVKLVGLAGCERRYPRELSGGMRQRVGIARALASDAPVLLMDEPLSALDAQTRSLMQVELLNIWETNRRTVVYVTHNISEAALLGDRIVVLSRRPGRIREILEVPFPRPRGEALTAAPEFLAFTQRLWDELKAEAREAMEEGEGA
ncbi:MAG TPA: ABC transporter ATP-binding protein [Firmicutes bacterium]|nr:ABC transporter ATP-binding protein [Bacillota bacterium]